MSSVRFPITPAKKVGKDKKAGKDKNASEPRQDDSNSRPAPKADEPKGQEGSMRDLIQFFRKTAPPSTNLMSIPDDFSSSEEDRWQRFKTKVFRRRKAKRRPPVIMLPDSAVSARTTDGHRYIAISIPTEYSHLAPLPCTQYPVYDSIEAAFHREINSRFGMWKNPPSNRVVAVLNPVDEEQRKSGSATAQPNAFAGRARPRSVSVTPTQQQRYTPGRGKGLTKTKSLGGSARKDTRLAEAPPLPQHNEGQSNMAWPNSQDVLLEVTGASKSGNTREQDNPIITLTLPSRKSSKRVTKQPATPPRTSEDGRKSGDGNLEGDESGSGSSSGLRRARDSFAASSIVTTNSSPAPVLRAQTAKAVRSVPIVVRSGGTEVESSKLDADDSVKPGPSGTSDVKRTQSREKRVRDRKKRDLEGATGETEQDQESGKGKEPAPRAFPLVPKRMPSSSYSSQAQSSESSQQKDDRAEREAQYVSKALAEKKETLENLPREELLRRYESLREQNIYDREKRLRRLERNRDAWARALPTLLQDLNGLLREQHRILEGAGLAAQGGGDTGRSGSSWHRRHSLDVSLPSFGSDRSLGPLEPRRSRSVLSSSESHPSYLSTQSRAD